MKNTTGTKIDRLMEDDPITDQYWACLSFLSPEGVRNCNIRALKIRGVFATREEADKRAKELQQIDSNFHVFVGEVGKWLPWDPDPNDVKDQIYYEKELQKLMEGYKENLDKSKKMHHQYKQDMLKQAASQEQSREDKTKSRLRKKLETKNQQKKIDNLVNSQLDTIDDDDDESDIKITEDEIKNSEQLAKAERGRITNVQKEISDSTQTLESIDSKLAKIQELYKKLNKN